MKLGKRPARQGAVRLELAKYVNLSRLPTPPADFGHGALVKDYGLLGNDEYGDCVWAGACHEHMMWNAAAGRSVGFLTNNALAAYSATTGFSPGNPDSDQGTDMQLAAKFRQKTGVADSKGNVHRIGAYAALEPGNLDMLLVAAYIFGAVGCGFELPSSAEPQFDHHLPWTVKPGARIEGGHYVPIMGHRDGLFIGCTWGQLQPIGADFVTAYNDEGLAYLSADFLNGDKTVDGFDWQAMQSDLADLQA